MFVCAITHVKLMYCTLMCVCLAVRVGWNLCILPKGLFLWWIIIICCEYKHTYTFSFRLIWIDAIDYYDIPRTIVKTSETIVKVTKVKCPDNDKTHAHTHFRMFLKKIFLWMKIESIILRPVTLNWHIDHIKCSLRMNCSRRLLYYKLYS